MKLINLTKAESAYEIKYYNDETCSKIITEAVGACCVSEAAKLANEIAYSEFHVLSIREIGILNLRDSDIKEPRCSKG